MAHFAELDGDNLVMRVVVVDNEHEESGEEWCKLFFRGGNWKQTSYNNNIRKNYAGRNFTYDVERDAFIPPQPFPSWSLNEDTCNWDSPTPIPDDDKHYEWNETTTSWDEVTN
jgi:hypothetical protein